MYIFHIRVLDKHIILRT